MKTLFLLISLLSITAQAQNNEGLCYERKYSPEHMQKNPGQSLSSANIYIYGSAENLEDALSRNDSMLYMDGCPRGGCGTKKFTFSATPKSSFLNNKAILCADFQADGEQDYGCLSIEKSRTRDAIIVSPVKVRYFDGYEYQEPRSVVLWHCPGSFSDGEGCAVPTEKVLLDSQNPADHGYVLEHVSCHRPE